MDLDNIVSLLTGHSTLADILSNHTFYIHRIMELKTWSAQQTNDRCIIKNEREYSFLCIGELARISQPESDVKNTLVFLDYLQDIRGSGINSLLTKIIVLEYRTQVKKIFSEDYDPKEDYGQISSLLKSLLDKLPEYGRETKAAIKAYESGDIQIKNVNRGVTMQPYSPNLDPWNPQNQVVRRRIRSQLPEAFETLKLYDRFPPEKMYTFDKAAGLLGENPVKLRVWLKANGIKPMGVMSSEYVGVLAAILTSPYPVKSTSSLQA